MMTLEDRAARWQRRGLWFNSQGHHFKAAGFHLRALLASLLLWSYHRAMATYWRTRMKLQ